ncbi:MAG: TolC family protein [Pseudomonadota bacterium]
MSVRIFVRGGGLLCLLAIAMNACADDGLASYFDKALVNDPEFAAAQASYAAEVESRTIARAGLLPSLNLSVEANSNRYQRQDTGIPTTRGFNYNTGTLGLRFNQPLFDLERWANYREGDARAGRADIVLADARQNLALRLAETYFDYLLAFDTLELADAQAQAVTAQRNRAENLFRGGAATITDVEESKAQEQLASAQRFVAQNAITQRRREVGKLIGELPALKPVADLGASQQNPVSGHGSQPDESAHPAVGTAASKQFKGVMDAALQARLSALVVPKLELPEPNDLAAWTEAAQRNNLRVQSARALLAIAGFQRDRSRAGYFPKLALVAIHQDARHPNYLTDQDKNSRVGVELSMNLFAGGGTRGADRQSQAQYEKARQELQTATQDAEIAASEAFLGVSSAVAQVRALQQSLISAEIALRGMEIGQKAGLRTNSEVLNAQQQLFSTTRDLQKAGYDYLLNRLRLQAVTGALSDEDVALIDALRKP